MERDELIDLLTQELSADPDNNRLNRILEAADQYAEQLVSESIDNYKTAVIDSIINAINSVVVMSHTGPWKPGEEQLIMREFDEWEADEARELSLGERISMYLEKRGMSQKNLAKAAHLREVTVSRYISNTRIPNANILLQIARALNVSTDELLGNEQSSSLDVSDTNVGDTISRQEAAINNLSPIQLKERTEKRMETHGVCLDAISRPAAQTELMMKCERYALTRESHGMVHVEWSSDLISVADAMDAIRDLPPVQPELDSENLVRMIETGITATNSNDAYSLGMRNGMRWCKSLIDGVDPKFEDGATRVDDGTDSAELLSAQPEPKEGEWIPVHPLQGDDPGAYMCSKCKTGMWEIRPSAYHYCPNCGADMRGEENE